MTNHQIRNRVAKLHNKLKSILQMQESTVLELKHVREKCQHSDKERWTNNDGDGQFIVERCKVCGMQTQATPKE